jgi:hypothetical protein
MKKLFLLMLLLISSVNAQEFITIPDLNLSTGSNSNVLDLDDYFNGSSEDWTFKFREGSDGLIDVSVVIGSNGNVNINAENPGRYSVIFLADNDSIVLESNDVELEVEGSAVVNQTFVYDFFPVATVLNINKGDKQNFAVSGDNVSAEWFLNGLKLPATTGVFEYDAILVGTHTVEVKVGDKSNTWNLIVEDDVILENSSIENPPEIEIKTTSQCGNGKKEKGENCGNCPSDVRCSKGSVCKNSICVKDEGINSLFLWMGLLGVIIVGLVVGIVFAKKKGMLDNLSFGFVKNIFKKKEEEPKEESKIEKKEKFLEKPSSKTEKKEPVKDLSSLKTYLLDNLKKGFKKEELIKSALGQGWKQNEIDEILEVKENLKPLYDYISNNLKQGFKKEDLVKSSLQQGWKQSEIDEVTSKL